MRMKADASYDGQTNSPTKKNRNEQMKKMNKLTKIFALCILAACCLASCSDSETYADKKNKERSAISQYISEHGIKVISEEKFNKDSTTNVENNEYVLFENTGVYMQIVRQGTGRKLLHGEAAELLIRFHEWNILGDSLQWSNINQTYAYLADKMVVYNSYGVFTASFTSGMMYSRYGSYVPSGWLVPLTYIKIGRQSSAEDEIAHVKLIVPADQGTETATTYVYPCHYDLYIQEN